ncbi:helix-turn-helix domain-containing protein [Listeria kieliensis]
MTINEKIETLRKSKGITKTHIAKQFNKTIAWYYGISKGEINVKAEDLEKFADILGVDVAIFFTNEVSEKRISGVAKV